MSNRCPISGKYVPRKNPSDGYLVLSPDGEEVRFCCPSHKTRYLRENPGSVEVNPMRVPDSGSVAAIARMADGGLSVVVVDMRTAMSGDLWDSILGVIALYPYEHDHVLDDRNEFACTVVMAKAVSGYGPLLYDLAAYAQAQIDPDCPGIFPSDIQSKDASRFWRRQGTEMIAPLSRAQFKAKYRGLDPISVFRTGNLLSRPDKAYLFDSVDRFFSVNFHPDDL